MGARVSNVAMSKYKSAKRVRSQSDLDQWVEQDARDSVFSTRSIGNMEIRRHQRTMVDFGESRATADLCPVCSAMRANAAYGKVTAVGVGEYETIGKSLFAQDVRSKVDRRRE